MGLGLVMMAALAALPVSGQQAVDSHPKATGETPNQSDIPFFSHDLPTPDNFKPDAFHFHTKPLPLFDAMPGSPAPPPLSPEEARQWKKALDEKENWTLMTPEEILNLPTEEKIMGVPESDDQKNLTVEQRYLNRLNDQNRAISATNALRLQDASSLDNGASQGLPDGLSPEGRPYGKANRPMTDMWGRSLNPAFQRNQAFQPNQSWHGTFIHTRATLAPDPEQEAAMQRFRILLGSATPEKLPTMYQSSPSTVPAPDPNMQALPAFNPAGNSFTPMKENFNKPAGLMPLPGIVNRPVTTTKPALYAPKLPPWLTGETPSPGTQQRVF